jgi:3-hydroxybutyryl-CoA dehydrogenase
VVTGPSTGALIGSTTNERARGASVEKVGVVGCGLMGSGIAEVCARAGADVIVTERDAEALKAGEARVERSLSRAVASGKVTDEDAAAARANLTYAESFDALEDRDLVVEAVLEEEHAKEEVFRHLDEVVRSEDAILATNTSSIPIIKLAMATKRPQHVIGMHFFNPVPVLKLVEVISSLLTSEDTTDRVRAFATDRLGKRVISSPDRAGFVVNALLIPYLLSAIRMLESGFASAEDIDTGMVIGCAHPLGPLALTDLIGLDTTQAVAESLYEEFKEPHLAPPPLLARMTQAGLLGRKSGQGFFAYKS